MKRQNEAFTEEKIKTVLKSNSEEAKSTIEDEDKFERLVQRLENKLKLVPCIGKYASDIACMVSLVRRYINKEYTDIPIGTIISIVSTFIYIISPIDLIPDYIPVVGYIDDIAILSWVLKSINSDVEEYKKWRTDNNKQIIDEI
ncbi:MULTISPECIES: YkvA family protein [Clostridium]|uniref:DUF1232 domain-containing protein n=1 Tax=Clostridium cibarium TaxID=2762247 RepID=A0ABR8PYX8_9CLOT|nr:MULTISPECIES: YkvA family protein [Clostridium]MBD7913378.1 DUF1232 domain-containing protein [Clostridium cibarium]